MTAVSALILFAFFSFSGAAHAEKFDASSDYIKGCKYATCVGLAALRWSKANPYGVAVAVSMGTKPAVTEDKIKMVLTQDLKHYGIEQVKFYYEQNDVPSSVMTLHVRGGTEGPFNISNVRQEVKTVAERAKLDNPVFIPE